MSSGVQDCLSVEADDHVVIVVSDANLRRYGISPAQLATAMNADDRANVYTIFIAQLQDEVS